MSALGEEINIEVTWDASSNKHINKIQRSLYQRANIIIIIYDMTNKESFNKLTDWNKRIDDNSNIHVEKCLIANKSDLVEERVITNTEGVLVGNSLKMEYYETSATTGENVIKAFMGMIIKAKRKNSYNQRSSFRLDSRSIYQKKSCC